MNALYALLAVITILPLSIWVGSLLKPYSDRLFDKILGKSKTRQTLIVVGMFACALIGAMILSPYK